MNTPKYIVKWERPYQGAGVETAASEECGNAKDAYDRLVSVQCDPGCSKARAFTLGGKKVSSRQLRARARIK